MRRRLEVPEPVELQLDGTARLSPRADDTTIDALLGVPVAGAGWVRATSSEHLPGDVMARASAALDGYPSTAWTPPLVAIGRASCRDRVVTYVKISGVAVTFQK